MALSDEEAQKTYTYLSNAAQEFGLDWVLDQVDEKIALGKTAVKKVPTKVDEQLDTGDLWGRSVEDHREERGALARYVVAEEYSSTERLEVLSRLRNSWGWRLGAVLNSPGKHPFALDRRLDAGSGGPAARREVKVGLFRRVADRASEHRWVTDAGRAPRGVAGGALVMSPGVRAGRR